MNLQAYAAHRREQGLRGTSHVAVLKAIKTGRLSPPAVKKIGQNWVIDPLVADSQWSENTDTVRAKDSGSPRVGPPPKAGGSGITQAQATAIRTTIQAKILELDLKERQGELVSRAAAKRARFETARNLRDTFRRLPLLCIGEISQVVSGLTAEQRAMILILLEKHIVAILEEASGSKS